MPTSFAGHGASSSECVIEPKGHETGLTGSAGRTLISSPTGFYAMARLNIGSRVNRGFLHGSRSARR